MKQKYRRFIHVASGEKGTIKGPSVKQHIEKDIPGRQKNNQRQNYMFVSTNMLTCSIRKRKRRMM